MKYELEMGNDKTSLQFVTIKKDKCYQRLLQHILLVSRYRCEIYEFRGGIFKIVKQASPCDLSEVKSLMFNQDEEGGGISFSDKVLEIGGICAVTIEGDAKSPQGKSSYALLKENIEKRVPNCIFIFVVGVCFWHEATKEIKLTQFYDNHAHDKLESLLVQ